jgi:signal transduction histidine kinase
MTRQILSCPPRLQALWRSAAVDETVSSLRHDLRNKLASIRNSNFYIRRRAEKTTTLLKDDPKVGEFFGLVESELDLCTQLLAVKAAPSPLSAVIVRPLVSELIGELLQSLQLPKSVEVRLASPPAAKLPAAAVPLDVELALFVLIENAVEAAVEAGGGKVSLEERTDKGGFWIDVNSACEPQETQAWLRPFYTRKPGRMGLGLKIAKRLTAGWAGKLELTAANGTLRASLWFPA